MKKDKILHSILVFATIFMLVQLMIGNAYAIKHGAPDEEDHPYVCWIVTWDGTSNYVYLGTGTLISPTVVLTAGHMTFDENIANVWVSFESQADFIQVSPLPPDDPESLGWLEADDWEYYEDFWMGGLRGITDWIGNDVGIVVLSEAVTGITPAVLPSEGLVDTLPMKQGVDLVGYGVQCKRVGGGMPPSLDWINFGYRYQAHAQIIATDDVFSDGFMRLTANPGQGKGGTCFGDSGGPILLAGTDTILGVCSWGTNGECAGVSYEQRIDIKGILDWISTFLT
jgi:hypothetical protein